MPLFCWRVSRFNNTGSINTRCETASPDSLIQGPVNGYNNPSFPRSRKGNYRPQWHKIRTPSNTGIVLYGTDV